VQPTRTWLPVRGVPQVSACGRPVYLTSRLGSLQHPFLNQIRGQGAARRLAGRDAVPLVEGLESGVLVGRDHEVEPPDEADRPTALLAHTIRGAQKAIRKQGHTSYSYARNSP